MLSLQLCRGNILQMRRLRVREICSALASEQMADKALSIIIAPTAPNSGYSDISAWVHEIIK